jgi:hypothetical protein
MTKETPPAITPLEFEEADHARAEIIARALGYEQTAYTSTSGLWGLFCLKENPERYPRLPHRSGCVIKTREFGLVFVQTEDEFERELERGA